MLYENPVPLNLRLRMQPRSVTVDRMPAFLQNASGIPNVCLSAFEQITRVKHLRSLYLTILFIELCPVFPRMWTFLINMLPISSKIFCCFDSKQGPCLLENFGGHKLRVIRMFLCYCAYHTNIILLFAFRWRHDVHSTVVRPFCKIGKLWKWYILGTICQCPLATPMV